MILIFLILISSFIYADTSDVIIYTNFPITDVIPHGFATGAVDHRQPLSANRTKLDKSAWGFWDVSHNRPDTMRTRIFNDLKGKILRFPAGYGHSFDEDVITIDSCVTVVDSSGDTIVDTIEVVRYLRNRYVSNWKALVGPPNSSRTSEEGWSVYYDTLFDSVVNCSADSSVLIVDTFYVWKPWGSGGDSLVLPGRNLVGIPELVEWIDSLGNLDYDVDIEFTYSVWHDSLIGNDTKF